MCSLGLEGRAQRPQAERTARVRTPAPRAGRDRDAARAAAPTTTSSNGKREDEEADVLAVDRIDDAEGLPVPPEQVRLPVPVSGDANRLPVTSEAATMPRTRARCRMIAARAQWRPRGSTR